MSIAALFISPNFYSNSFSSSSTNGNTTPSSSSSKTHTSKSRNSSKSIRIPPLFKTNFNNNPSTNTNKIQSPNPNLSFQSLSSIGSEENIKMPTAPWMSGPLLIPSNEVLDLSTIRKEKKSDSKFKRKEWSLTERIRGGRGKQAMRKIVQSITKLKDLENAEEKVKEVEAFEFQVPLEGVSNSEVKMPWAMTQRNVFPRMKKEKVVTAAEKELPEPVLKKLRGDAVKITQWVKAKKAGVTQAVVDEIKMIWKANELAMIKFDLPLSRYMDRARDIVEFKTGGLVVWTRKDVHVIYRGCHYKSPPKAFPELHSEDFANEVMCSSKSIFTNNKYGSPKSSVESQEIAVHENVSWKDGKEDLSFKKENVGLQPVHGTLYEREADRLLDGLGPRFIDWWWPKPLPVDADLLAEVVPGFRPPFRRCPPRVRRQLADSELTYLRKSARPLPTHFALGRNKKLQGLAAAMIKLWEKSPIVKIAIKCGIPGTDHEQMAWELKRLTGGVLILRNKFFIIFYRGKDFLPPRVENLIVNRETELKRCQLQEEGARWKATESLHYTDEINLNYSPIGTVSEFQDIQTKYGYMNNDYGHYDVQHEAEKLTLEKELRKQKRKLFILEVKMERSLKELSKLKSPRGPVALVTDQELITEEERECFRRIGLKMQRTLVLGRRGIFDGIIGSIHLHWKHKEVVKVITMQGSFSQVLDTASVLEIESGGILVAVVSLRKGHAIILYRGKNYRRPMKLLSENLLTKRAALTRSLEMQRTGSLKFFAKQRQLVIANLELKLRELQRKDENVASKVS